MSQQFSAGVLHGTTEFGGSMTGTLIADAVDTNIDPRTNQSERELYGDYGASVVRHLGIALAAAARARKAYLSIPADLPRPAEGDLPLKELHQLEVHARDTHRTLARHFIDENERATGDSAAWVDAMNLQSANARLIYNAAALREDVLAAHPDQRGIWLADDIFSAIATDQDFTDTGFTFRRDRTLPPSTWSFHPPMDPALTDEQLRQHPGPVEPTGLEDERTSCPNCHKLVRPGPAGNHDHDPYCNAQRVGEGEELPPTETPARPNPHH